MDNKKILHFIDASEGAEPIDKNAVFCVDEPEIEFLIFDEEEYRYHLTRDLEVFRTLHGNLDQFERMADQHFGFPDPVISKTLSVKDITAVCEENDEYVFVDLIFKIPFVKREVERFF